MQSWLTAVFKFGEVLTHSGQMFKYLADTCCPFPPSPKKPPRLHRSAANRILSLDTMSTHLTCHQDLTEKVDVYGMAMVYYCMLALFPPYTDVPDGTGNIKKGMPPTTDPSWHAGFLEVRRVFRVVLGALGLGYTRESVRQEKKETSPPLIRLAWTLLRDMLGRPLGSVFGNMVFMLIGYP